MKNRFPVILSVITCGLAIFCLVQISDLKNQVTHLQRQLDDQSYMFQSRLDAFLSQAQTLLETEASLLSAWDWVCGEPDLETMQAPVTCTVTPKTMIPGVTTAQLVCNEERWPMTDRGDGTFSVTLDHPIFEPFHLQRVVFTENGVQSTETLDIRDELFRQCLSFPYGHYSGSATFAGKEVRYEGSILIDNFPREDAKGLTLVADYGSREEQVPLEMVWRDDYSMECPFNRSFSLEDESGLTLYLEARDNHGLIYRQVLDQILPDQNGAPQSASPARGTIEVYNAQRKLLWTGEY